MFYLICYLRVPLFLANLFLSGKMAKTSKTYIYHVNLRQTLVITYVKYEIYEYLCGKDKRFLFTKSKINSELNKRMNTFFYDNYRMMRPKNINFKITTFLVISRNS